MADFVCFTLGVIKLLLLLQYSVFPTELLLCEKKDG